MAASADDRPENAWSDSLREIMRNIITTLPDHTTLGELIAAARQNAHMAQVLDLFTVQELIDAAKSRPIGPAPQPKRRPRAGGEDGADADDQGGRVIRRRADAPDGDLRILRALAESGPLRETEVANRATLSSEQVRLLLKSLRLRGFIHLEGSGLKRRYRITRHGATHLRRSRQATG